MGRLGVLYTLLYHPHVLKKDLPRISASDKQHIKDAIETKLRKSPEIFGEPLRRTLKGYWKLRVGDYRVIYKVSGNSLLVLRIGHRREVYQA